jgi:glyoxylase-like metal-dependent hydrolase (beta-lactamase superfamily II)
MRDVGQGGAGSTSFEHGGSFEPGRPVRIAPGVQRLVAPNASIFTGPGTNTYLLGDPPIAVLDPGPDDPVHVAAIRAAAPDLQWVFVTHTHPDHSPGARRLAEECRARLVGKPAPATGPQDRSFVPERIPAFDERFELAQTALALRAIATPGHASNHVCWLMESCGLLFSGDHVLDGVTPVIVPPDGDMSDYLESLGRLAEYPLAAIAPGHGRVLAEPKRVIERIVAHRLRREAKVLNVLASLAQASLEELLPRVYDDVDSKLHGLARHSLKAHLLKLQREGRCALRDGGWHAQ